MAEFFGHVVFLQVERMGGRLGQMVFGQVLLADLVGPARQHLRDAGERDLRLLLGRVVVHIRIGNRLFHLVVGSIGDPSGQALPQFHQAPAESWRKVDDRLVFAALDRLAGIREGSVGFVAFRRPP